MIMMQNISSLIKKSLPLIVCLFLFLALPLSAEGGSLRRKTISYDKFQGLVKNNKIENGLIRGLEFRGRFTKSGGPPGSSRRFRVVLPKIDSDILAEWDKAEIDYRFVHDRRGWKLYLVRIIPWALAFISLGLLLKFLTKWKKGKK